LSRTRIAFCCLLVMFAAGCKAQSTTIDQQLNRRIEIQVRSTFPVPPGYSITIGPRSKSDFAGYDNVAITFQRGTNKSTITFLLSTDNKTLARLEKFDISKDPADAVSYANRPIRGNPEAKVVLVNFDDLECPYCSKMHSELFPGLLDRYKGQVKVAYKNYPLVEIHPWAMHAAVDSNCLADQSGTAYWNYVDYLHANGAEVNGTQRNAEASKTTLDRLAREEGKRNKLDVAKLDACLAKQDEAPVRASMKEGEALGVDGTPMLFVNGERIGGAVPEDVVWAAVDRALAGVGIQPPATTQPAATSIKDKEAAPVNK
jgi:protein-disulfide isomerase